jgi:hypothetical protein
MHAVYRWHVWGRECLELGGVQWAVSGGDLWWHSRCNVANLLWKLLRWVRLPTWVHQRHNIPVPSRDL